MHELPYALFGSKDAGDPEGDRGSLLPAADLRPAALYLHEVREVRGHVLRHGLELLELAARVLRSRELQPLLDFGTPPAEGSERITERHVVTLREERLVDRGIAIDDGSQRLGIFLDHGFELSGGRHSFLLPSSSPRARTAALPPSGRQPRMKVVVPTALPLPATE